MTKFWTEQKNFQSCFSGGQLESLQILEQKGGDWGIVGSDFF